MAFLSLMKNPASLTSEGAGGFSLPNKPPRFNVALATGLFFNLPVSLCQQSGKGHTEEVWPFLKLLAGDHTIFRSHPDSSLQDNNTLR